MLTTVTGEEASLWDSNINEIGEGSCDNGPNDPVLSQEHFKRKSQLSLLLYGSNSLRLVQVRQLMKPGHTTTFLDQGQLKTFSHVV